MSCYSPSLLVAYRYSPLARWYMFALPSADSCTSAHRKGTAGLSVYTIGGLYLLSSSSSSSSSCWGETSGRAGRRWLHAPAAHMHGEMGRVPVLSRGTLGATLLAWSLPRTLLTNPHWQAHSLLCHFKHALLTYRHIYSLEMSSAHVVYSLLLDYAPGALPWTLLASLACPIPSILSVLTFRHNDQDFRTSGFTSPPRLNSYNVYNCT